MKTLKALGLAALASIPGTSSAGSIESYCRDLVGDSYRLMEVCITEEREARSRLKRMRAEPRIRNYCEKLVGDSYQLMEVCITEEEAAKKRLNR